MGVECPRCGSSDIKASKYEAKCKRCGCIFPVVPDFVKQTFEKQPFAEYCMDCGIFVAYAYEHIARGHIVVRRVL